MALKDDISEMYKNNWYSSLCVALLIATALSFGVKLHRLGAFITRCLSAVLLSKPMELFLFSKEVVSRFRNNGPIFKNIEEIMEMM